MEWKWSKANEKSLAQFVSDRTVELLPKLSTSPFDLLQTPNGKLKLVQSIYEQLLNQRIQYAYEKYHPEDDTQRIRTPKEVLDIPGEGTCLDLALLFCGLCFGYELLPLLIVIEGHALAAVSLNHQRREWDGFARERNLFHSTELFQGDENQRELQKLIEDEAYVAVECTGFAQTQSFTSSMPEAVGRTTQGILTFERAIAAGREQLENSGREFQFAIDIAVAHYLWKIEPTALSQLEPASLSQPEKIKPPFYIPRRSAEFVGRENDLETLHQELQSKERVAITAVTGMGGIGKTELAIQYAHQYRQEGTYPGGICWFDVRAEELPAKIINLATTYRKLNIPKNVDDLAMLVNYCWDNWFPGEVLLILDDVTNSEAIEPYLPNEPRFKVLITTRKQGLKTNFTNLELQVLTETKALEFLALLVGGTRVEQEPDTAKEICAWLGYLPLGIELVGRYLKGKRKLSLAKMQQLLQRKKLDHRALKTTVEDMRAQRGVRAAFELSWEDLDESAQQVACLLSVLAAAPFPWGLVESCLPEEDEEDLEDIRDEVLLESSLLQEKGEESYQLHQLIHQFLREKLADSDWSEDLKQKFCKVMAAVARNIPQTTTLEDITTFTDAIPHLVEAVENWNNFLEDEDLTWPFIGLSYFYEGQGIYQQALPYRKQSLSQAEGRFGKEHLDVAASINNLAMLYQYQGKYEESESLYLQALELYKKLLGAGHPDVATSLNNLAILYQYKGRYEEAESLYLQALELSKKLLGAEHPDVAKSLNNLAMLYQYQGRYEEAESLYLQALELYKKFLGTEHPDVAKGLNNLAILYQYQGRYEEAESLSIQSLELSNKFLGVEHPDIAKGLNNLAVLYQHQGKYEEAKSLFLQSLELSKKLLGTEHPDVAKSLNNLAMLYQYQGKYEEAESLSIQSLELSKKFLGTEHPDVAKSLNNLAALYQYQGKYEEAESLSIQSLELSKKLLSTEHPDVAKSLNNLAMIYHEQGKYEEAEPLYLQALELYKKFLGTEHPDIAQSIHNLAGLYHDQGRYEEAEPLYLQALELRKKFLGTEHPDVASTLNNLAFVYDKQGRYEEAESLSIQCLELYEKLFGFDHPNVASSLNNLALFYDKQGRYEEAELLYLQVLELRKKLLGSEHLDVVTSLNNLALFYDEQERYKEAEPFYLQALELRKKLLGTEHLDVALNLNNQRRYEEAEPWYLKTLELKKKLLGVEHPDVADCLFKLAILYEKQERYDEAETLYKNAITIAETSLGAHHPSTATFRRCLEELKRRSSD